MPPSSFAHLPQICPLQGHSVHFRPICFGTRQAAAGRAGSPSKAGQRSAGAHGAEMDRWFPMSPPLFPGLYFITGAVFRNAYLEIGARHWVHGLCSMGIGLLGILVFTVSDPVLLQDGMVTDDVIQLAVGICWLYLGAILLIKAYLNFRGEKEGEEQA